MVTGLTRIFAVALDDVRRVLDPRSRASALIGLTMLIARGRTVFIADTSVHELPTPEELADIADAGGGQGAPSSAMSRGWRCCPSPTSAIRCARRASASAKPSTCSTRRQVDFEYDGEMAADVALDPDLMRQHYPFCRLSGPANVLIMPALHSANIASKLLQELGGGTVIGPILLGLEKPVQIVPMGATVIEIVNMAALAAHETLRYVSAIVLPDGVPGGAGRDGSDPAERWRRTRVPFKRLLPAACARRGGRRRDPRAGRCRALAPAWGFVAALACLALAFALRCARRARPHRARRPTANALGAPGEADLACAVRLGAGLGACRRFAPRSRANRAAASRSSAPPCGEPAGVRFPAPARC